MYFKVLFKNIENSLSTNDKDKAIGKVKVKILWHILWHIVHTYCMEFVWKKKVSLKPSNTQGVKDEQKTEWQTLKNMYLDDIRNAW